MSFCISRKRKKRKEKQPVFGFLQFIYQLFKKTETTSLSLSKCCYESYEQTGGCACPLSAHWEDHLGSGRHYGEVAAVVSDDAAFRGCLSFSVWVAVMASLAAY